MFSGERRQNQTQTQVIQEDDMSSPAGWYPQPDGQQRYWDGEQWTERFAPGGAPVMPSALGQRNWFLQHKIITAIGAFLLLAVITGIATGGGNNSINTAPVAEPVATSATPDQAALDQAAASQAVADKAAADQAASDQVATDKAAADQAAADKAAADQAAADQVAAEKAAADKATSATAARGAAAKVAADKATAARAARRAAAAKAATPKPEVFGMPNLIGENLQGAQDKLQALGSYLMVQQDAAGLGRIQVLDSNWTVCSQSPAAGKTVAVDTVVILASVKLSEQCP